jgi:hypothetical protein
MAALVNYLDDHSRSKERPSVVHALRIDTLASLPPRRQELTAPKLSHDGAIGDKGLDGRN